MKEAADQGRPLHWRTLWCA